MHFTTWHPSSRSLPSLTVRHPYLHFLELGLTTTSVSLYVAAQGAQFITGACTADADCASSCCGFNSGKCAAPIVAQERDGGCGFGDAQPNDLAAQALTGGATDANADAPAAGAGAAAANASTAAAAAGATSAAKAPGTQFITGECASDADCASACCGFKSGKCAAALVAQEADGCGFGDAQPNNAAVAGGAGAGAEAANANANANGSADANANATADAQGAQATAAAAAAAPGTQFITGACTSDADCGSACCGFNSGKCAGPAVAQERDGGCGFGDAQPNDNAAKALQGRRLGRRGAALM